LSRNRSLNPAVRIQPMMILRTLLVLMLLALTHPVFAASDKEDKQIRKLEFTAIIKARLSG